MATVAVPAGSLAGLAPGAVLGEQVVAAVPTPVIPVVTEKSVWTGAWGLLSFIVWFIVVAIIITVILWAVRPVWAMNGGVSPTVNAGKIIGAAVVASLIIVLIIFIIAALARSARK